MSSTVTIYPHVEKPNDGPARLTRVPRVRVAQLGMDYLAHGWSPEEMCRQHPYLTIAEAYSAMLYYWDHAQEIDSEIESETRDLGEVRARGHTSPFFSRMRAKGLL
jgi:uncharacterized protein (DUF433 family)